MAKWSMTLESLWDEVQLYAQDSTGRWETPQRDALVNSVVAAIARECKCSMESATQNIIADQATYALPAGCPNIRFLRKVWISGKEVLLVDRARLENYSVDGIEYNEGRNRWYASEGKVTITPTPGENITDGLTLEIAGAPDTVSGDSDPIPLPSDLQLAAVYGCAQRVLTADERFDSADRYGALYRLEIGKYKADGGEWQEPRQDSVIVEDDLPPPTRSFV